MTTDINPIIKQRLTQVSRCFVIITVVNVLLTSFFSCFVDAKEPKHTTAIAAIENTSNHQPKQPNCYLVVKPFAASVCVVKNPNPNLQLFWHNNKHLLLSFQALLDTLHNGKPAQQLIFATNAGMYNQQFMPIGLFIYKGITYTKLNLNTGYGNFHLIPNGVFWLDKSGNAYIHESNDFFRQQQHATLKNQPTVYFATQSGPLLVLDNQLHAKFLPNSPSKKIRNGVGVCRNRQIYFVISDEPVNFYHFALFFKQQLHCPNALFLDGGTASALYSPSLKRHDKQLMGVMVGLTK